MRAETLVAHKKELLSKIDVYKQLGYFAGLGTSFLFYKLMHLGLEISDSKEQIEILHYLLLMLQMGIILLAIRSFKRV